jgi:hypothetical protein
MQMGEAKRCEAVASGDDPAGAFLAAHRLAELPTAVFQLGEVWAQCERCVATGDAAAAERLYAALAAFAPRDARGGAWTGAAAYYLGVLAGAHGRWDLAAAHFEDALRVAGGAAMPTRAAQLGYARALLGRGAPGDAARAERLLVTLLLAVRAAVPGPPPVLPGYGASDELPRFVFRREGDYWALAGAGPVTRVRGVRGFDYLGELLRHPHEQLYVLDLAGLGASVAPTVSSAEALEHGLRIAAAPTCDTPLDHRARAAYRARWQELHAEAAAAVADNDPGRAARARAELEMLADALRAATRMPRGAATPQERARVNVRNCITAALRIIRRHDDGLWRHLVNSIKTGTFCVYAPDRAVQWEL